MLNDIYNKRIIELAGNIPRLGRLPDPHASATAHSKLCGSTVKVDLKMDGPVVTDFAHDVKACALGQASSSIMASHVVGSTAGELRELRETVRKMLKENGTPPQGKWADIALLEPVRDYKARHASTMLTFDAVVDAIGQIEAGRSSRRRRKGKSPPHTVRHAREGGHPVRREFSIKYRRLGVLDHPPSRMMTRSMLIQPISAGWAGALAEPPVEPRPRRLGGFTNCGDRPRRRN